MGIDQNLVRTFLSIYEHRSVTRAAEDLSSTQPTVNHALGRPRPVSTLLTRKLSLGSDHVFDPCRRARRRSRHSVPDP
ncbi:helix-turn-helix domain-containing protein [Arthrobacter sp. A5]|uniref:helix-turn-helix domain-containing protein n=1 Tax=Arthrobacter sp. A5 TaxID=576926 RepID=UPI003DAA08D7